MSMMSEKMTQRLYSVFAMMLAPLKRDVRIKGNFIPEKDRDRISRYHVLDATANNYLNDYLIDLGVIPDKRDSQGRELRTYQGYGEFNLLTSTIVDAVYGDSLTLDTNNAKLRELWDEEDLRFVISEAEAKGAQLGDIVIHVNLDDDGKPYFEWVDPAGFYIIASKFGKPSHVAIAYIDSSKNNLLYKLEYMLVNKVVYFKVGYFEVMKDNPNEYGFAPKDNWIREVADLTPNPIKSGDLEGWTILGKESAPVSEIPIVHIPFISCAGEEWGLSAIHYVFEAILDICRVNADLQFSASIAAIPIFWKEKDQFSSGVMVVNPVTGLQEPIKIQPGMLFDGEVGMVDNAQSLDAATKHRLNLLKGAFSVMKIPEWMFDPAASKVISGVALDINMFPLKTFITKMRDSRNKELKRMCKVILQRMGVPDPDLKDTKFNFGVIANLATQIMNAYSQIVLAGILSIEEARKALIEEGVLPQSIIDLNFSPNPDQGVNSNEDEPSQ